MKINEIKVTVVDVPGRGTFKSSKSRTSSLMSVIVEVHTSENIFGIGEAMPAFSGPEETISDITAAINEYISPKISGMNPLDIEAVLSRMEKAISAHFYAKAAVETALYDLSGKALGVPAGILLGGRLTDTIPLVGWIGVNAPEENAIEARQWVDKGFPAVKMKIGGDANRDIDRVRAVREAVGPDLVLRVDANESFTVHEAIKVINRLEKYNIESVEQPVPKWNRQGMATVAAAVDIPIMADESVSTAHDLIEVIRARAADIIKVRVQAHGGMLNTKKMIAIAEAAGIPCIIGRGFQLSIGAAAEIHVAASSQNIIHPSEMVGPLKAQDDVVVTPLDMSRGFVEVPKGHGLGLEIDSAKMTKYKRKQ